MSGFSAAWLRLREAADHAARNRKLLGLLEARFAEREHVTVLDLACGAGSNLRGQALFLPAHQSWRLVDHDQELLDAARAELIAWADCVESLEPMKLLKADRMLEIDFLRSDLSRFDGKLLTPDLDLVTAAAFFDLVSESWIEAFCATLAERLLPLYAVLSYDGVERWTRAHDADAAMLAAFCRHQSRDKGFGPAAGPRAVASLQATLERSGYVVETASSPWRLRPSEQELIGALADGTASAVLETALVPAKVVEAWRVARRIATACEIGHVDLFAQPS
ncbi:MAG: class I SAM-dependent methyltransferase [Methylocystis sp.]